MVHVCELGEDYYLRSFFGKQEGDFELVIRSIAAGKEEVEAQYRDDPDAGTSMEGLNVSM